MVLGLVILSLALVAITIVSLSHQIIKLRALEKKTEGSMNVLVKKLQKAQIESTENKNYCLRQDKIYAKSNQYKHNDIIARLKDLETIHEKELQEWKKEVEKREKQAAAEVDQLNPL